MIDNVDQNLGRLLATVEALGELDNTIVVVTSDNGGTAEGGPIGTRSYFSQFQRMVSRGPWPRDVPRDPDLIGGPRAAVHYPRGWGMASNTPFRLYKGNTFAGGVRVPFILSWPKGLRERGVRHQYAYVTDLHPTLLELAGVDRPAERHGPGRQGHRRRELRVGPARCDAAEPARGAIRGVRWQPRLLSRRLEAAHAPRRGTPYSDQEWQLFDVRTDPTEIDNVADEYPDRVRELADAWEAAAVGQYRVSAAGCALARPRGAVRRRPSWSSPCACCPARRRSSATAPAN